MKPCIVVLLWLALSPMTIGGMMGNFQGEPRESSQQHFLPKGLGLRHFLAMTGPLGAAASVFTTGFYEYGFCYTRAQCVAIRNRNREEQAQ